jgi:hypothetical protein
MISADSLPMLMIADADEETYANDDERIQGAWRR